MFTCDKKINFFNCFSKTAEIICSCDDGVIYATGTIISKDGHILTNKHVLTKFDDFDIIVKYNNGVYEAEVLYLSSTDDIGLIKISAETECFELEEKSYSIGDEIYGIGNPCGIGLSLYKGIITNCNKTIHYNDENCLFLQTNIEFDEGASGGPIFNKYGRLVGIMTFRLKKDDGFIQSVSFAIPSSVIIEFIKLESDMYEKNNYDA